jgi:hypothetical protein
MAIWKRMICNDLRSAGKLFHRSIGRDAEPLPVPRPPIVRVPNVTPAASRV